ncbi:MAG: sulfite exporter TauE/SafE family protein [Proteobacteria bacterium]|nr:sulfite exporter TauE/SafE family protein [Pseudomonadota bacterium]
MIGILAAMLIGVSLGLLGGGGSILTVPTIHYVFGVEAHAAIASSLLVVGVVSVVALIPHLRHGRVHLRVGLIFGASSMITAFGAARLSSHVPAGVLLVGFAAMMIVAGLAMLRPAANVRRMTSITWLVGYGAAVGLVTGFVGAGGGFIIVPALVVLVGLPIREATATSLLVIALNSFVAFSATASTVPLDGRVIGTVLVAAMAGGLVGGRLAGRLSPTVLRRAFGWFVLGMALVIFVAELPHLL